jgi:hypothetical protein
MGELVTFLPPEVASTVSVPTSQMVLRSKAAGYLLGELAQNA